MAKTHTIQASDNYFKISVCYHEAAHAICGLFNFLYIDRIHVISDKYEQGNTSYEIWDAESIEDELLSKIILIYEVQALYAGMVGEKIYYKDICGSDKFPMHLRIGSSNDIQAAAKIIHKHNLAYPGKTRHLFKKQIQSDTHNILLDYWSDIKLISHTLYKHKEINYDELRYFLTRKSINKEFWKDRLKHIRIIYNDRSKLEEKELKNILTQNQVVII